MSATLGVCWIFLWISAADAYYGLSNEKLKWHDAKNNSNFATPNIQVTNSSYYVNITSNLTEGEKVWVGFYKKETAFAYIGCGHINDASPEHMLPISRNTPGLCYSMCNKSWQIYVGLNKEKCFCIREKPSEDIDLPTCDLSPNGTWIAGGGNAYMSIYKRIKIDVNPSSKQFPGKCLVFQSNRDYFWDTCRFDYLSLCKQGEQAFPVHRKTIAYFHWQHYVQTCYKNKSSPIMFNDISKVHLKQTFGQAWTTVIKSEVIYKYNEYSSSISLGNNNEYGYVHRSKNVTVLSFTSNYSLELFSLQKSSVPKPTTDNIWMSTTVHLSPTMNDGSINSTEGLKLKKNSTPDSFNVSIPVSVSVIAIFLVAAVVLVIILKRRGKFQGICAKSSALENSSSKRNADTIKADNNVYKESPVDDYEQISDLKDNNNEDVKPDIGVEKSNHGHTYFILEPGSRESHTDGDMSDSRNNETEMNDDYHTLHSTKNFGTKADDTYDTTEKAAIKLKTLHETGCEKESPEKLNGNEEDTYNHISRNLLKNNKTDNIYGVTDNQENDYGDVNNGCEKNRHNGDDTYSHLNTTH